MFNFSNPFHKETRMEKVQKFFTPEKKTQQAFKEGFVNGFAGQIGGAVAMLAITAIMSSGNNKSNQQN